MSKFQGYAQESREGFDPIKAPDTSSRILNRADDTIRGMRQVRDADIANTSAYLKSFNEKMEAERASFSDYSELLQLNDKTKRDAIEIRAQQNAERQRELGANREGIYKAVAGLSAQAAGMITKYREDKYQSDYDEHLYRLYTQGPSEQSDAAGYIADKHTMHNLQITDIARLGGAAAAEANGSSPIQTAELRAQAHGLNTAELHAQADYMAQRWPLFLQQSFMNDKETQVKLYGPNGTFRTGTPSEAHSSKDKALVAQQLLKKHIQDNGFYGKSPAFLTDALTKMSEGTNQIVASAMTAEVSLQRQQQVDKVENIFRSSVGNAAQRFHLAYNYLSNIDPGQQSAARERLFSIMHDQRQVINGVVVGMSDDEVTEIMNSSFSHQPDKTLAQLFPGKLLEITQARQASSTNLSRAEATQRKLAIEKYERNLLDTFLEDLASGDEAIDTTDANLDLMKGQIQQQLGPDSAGSIRIIEYFKKYTQQAVYEKPIVAQIEHQIANGQITAEQIIRHENLSFDTKAKLIKKAAAEDPTNPSASEVTKFENFADSFLKRRSRVNAKTTTHESYFIMKERAVSDFIQRFKSNKANDPSTAFDNARAAFVKDFGDNDYEGLYAVVDYKSMVDSGLFHSGIFKNYEDNLPKTIDPETTALEIQRKIDRNPAAFNTPLVSEEPLKKVIEQYKFGQQITIIPQLELIARKHKISYSDLLSRQMEQYNLTPPPALFDTAKKVEQAIPEQYRVFMRYPSATNTDKMLMSSGLPSLYNRNFVMTSEQTRALDILAKYESSAYIQNNDGGYNAMNQGGTKGGREAINPGHSTTLLGQLLTDMTIGEVIQAQKDGRLHAAGRYQFTNNTGTLEDTIKLAGDIHLNSKFDAKTQDYLALTLMRSRGINPWIGPADHASSDERQLIESARSQPISFGASVWAQSDNMNPNLVKRKSAND